ncbi:unnamed protein product [Phyllotreta striolata]|uniref:Integrin beta n=1 Tax=Phyllotreta striolata TaxID=444603 RepID=A0A9N9TKY3_PHYSR|nr:unnamed protein product [Phyllotreta striolata]
MFNLAVQYLIIHSCVWVFASGQSASNCAAKETCEECIQDINCAWCINSENDNGGQSVHCNPKNESQNWCQQSDLISPSMSIQVNKDLDFSNDIDNPVQIRPQAVKLSLRKGETYDLRFKFKSAANYPVDLYYLMDLSKSMEEYKDNLATLGIQLAETMMNITTNFRLGFGSFIDKRELPFVSTVPQKLSSPCVTTSKVKCVSPYSFKNHLSLSADYQRFVSQVKAAKVSGNLDSPEGGLDAIIQAMVCKAKIGWREQARHLLVFSTDALFHIAGDGKLAGVIEPNPARCYEDDADYLTYDYPSVSQLNYVANENNVNIIFAIVKKGNDLFTAYKRLSLNVKNSNFGELSDKGGKNVVHLVVDNYNKIVQSVKFTHDAPAEVDIKFTSNCNSAIPGRCGDIHVGKEVDFVASIQVRDCPTDGSLARRITIRPEGLNENLTIDLDLLCECSCSSPGHASFKRDSEQCNNQGNLKCGICDCFEGRFGRNCQCDSSLSSSDNVTNCFMEGSTDICSGAGTCKCGKCECQNNNKNPNQRIYGQFCECDNYSCKREGGLLCSGKGNCNCKKCECQAGFTGDACECDESQVNCIAPGSDIICSNHGKCQCGRCECEMTDNNRYTGKYCEDCPSCPAQRCEELSHCVQCQVYKTGKYEKTCGIDCTAFETIVLESLDDNPVDDIKKCKIPDNDTCIINFDYYYKGDNNLVVRALKKKVCPEQANVTAWIFGVIASIVIAGIILLLIWKILTSIHDRREYAKFENERKNLKWGTGDNPLYKEATSTFANPAYKRNSVRMSK